MKSEEFATAIAFCFFEQLGKVDAVVELDVLLVAERAVGTEDLHTQVGCCFACRYADILCFMRLGRKPDDTLVKHLLPLP